MSKDLTPVLRNLPARAAARRPTPTVAYVRLADRPARAVTPRVRRNPFRGESSLTFVLCLFVAVFAAAALIGTGLAGLSVLILSNL
jgi:hypothetical protein